MDRVARRGPLARALGALKSHNAEKLKGGSFGVFQHPFCRKTSKNFREKIHSAAKNCKGEPFGSFQHLLWRKTAKKMNGGPFGLTRYCMLRGKTGKFFGSVR